MRSSAGPGCGGVPAGGVPPGLVERFQGSLPSGFLGGALGG